MRRSWVLLLLSCTLAAAACDESTSGPTDLAVGDADDLSALEVDLSTGFTGRPDLARSGPCGGTCTGGQRCINGTCECPAYQAFCGGVCIPVSADPNNCGACGVTCTGALACSAGTCAASCLPTLSICNHACVDLSSDSNHCGTCNTVCPINQGCVAGKCQPAALLGPPPAKCADGGPPIIIPRPGTTDLCAGNLAATTFTWALCSCKDVALTQSFTTDAYDSTKGPYLPGGVGAGVGLDQMFTASNTVAVGGTLWDSSAAGLLSTAPLTVKQELHVGGDVSTQVCTVSDDAYLAGNASGNPLTIGKTLHQPMGATRTGVSAAAVVPQAVSVPEPCDCSTGAAIPVGAIVAARRASNDNGLIGLDPNVFARANPPQRLDLPCGSYYLEAINNSIPVTIEAHGHTAIFIGGDLTATSPLTFTLDSGSTLDLFVAGTITATSAFTVGSPNFPALSRTYVGGASTLQLTSKVTLATNLYDAAAQVSWPAPVEVYGAVLAGDFTASQAVRIHYDRQVINEGRDCPGPGAISNDAGTATGCGSCKDCDNQACVNGACGMCTADAQCCPPLICSNGSCVLPIQ